MEIQGGVAILNKLVRVGLIEQVICNQRVEGGEKVSPANI